jgi:hypothetical protein
MKKYFILALAGLFLGFVGGCLEMAWAYLDTLPDPFSAHEHWYDILLVIPAIFSLPGVALDYWIFNPPDGCYGDEWDSRVPVILLNSLFWMIFIPTFSFYTYLAKCLWRDVKSACQKWTFLAKLFIHDKTRL